MSQFAKIVAIIAIAGIAAPSVASAKMKAKGQHAKTHATAKAKRSKAATKPTAEMEENRQQMMKKSQENKESGGKM